MKTGKIIGLVAVFTIMLLSFVSFASAQYLMDDEVWLKMKVSVKGHRIVSTTEPIESYSNAGTVYVRFTPAANPFKHDWQLWTFNETTGNWELIDSGTQYIYGERDGIVMKWSPHWNIGFAQFDAVINGFMKIKRNGLVTKSAVFTSDGCSLSGDWQGGVYGGCKVTGKKISPDKLPFQYP